MQDVAADVTQAFTTSRAGLIQGILHCLGTTWTWSSGFFLEQLWPLHLDNVQWRKSIWHRVGTPWWMDPHRSPQASLRWNVFGASFQWTEATGRFTSPSWSKRPSRTGVLIHVLSADIIFSARLPIFPVPRLVGSGSNASLRGLCWPSMQVLPVRPIALQGQMNWKGSLSARCDPQSSPWGFYAFEFAWDSPWLSSGTFWSSSRYSALSCKPTLVASHVQNTRQNQSGLDHASHLASGHHAAHFSTPTGTTSHGCCKDNSVRPHQSPQILSFMVPRIHMAVFKRMASRSATGARRLVWLRMDEGSVQRN